MPRPTRRRAFLWAIASCASLCAYDEPVFAQATTTIVDVDANGAQDALPSHGARAPGLSGNGRKIVFYGSCTLSPADVNFADDVYLRDLDASETILISVGTSGLSGGGSSQIATISEDENLVAFESTSTDLVGNDTNGLVRDIFVRNVAAATTTLVSTDASGVGANADSRQALICGGGRYVVFSSFASNLVVVPGLSPSFRQLYRKDLQSGAIEIVTLTPSGSASAGDYSLATSSRDGRWIAFDSISTDLVAGDTNGQRDVFLRDMQTGTTVRVNRKMDGSETTLASSGPALSADGGHLAFGSADPDLVAGDTNALHDGFVLAMGTGAVDLISRATSGAFGDRLSFPIGLSGDGRFVAVYSEATTFVPNDTNATGDVFVFDRATRVMQRMSVASDGSQGNGDSRIGYTRSLNPAGNVVGFESRATNFVPSDVNGNKEDAFVHVVPTTATNVCFADGSLGSGACPCGNFGAEGHGCAHSADFDGGFLQAVGVPSVSNDTVVLHAGELPPTTSGLFFQGTISVNAGAGAAFGDGVRCVAGTTIRLGTRTASAGVVRYGHGLDAQTVSVRGLVTSAVTRHYQVWFRNPPAFCTSSTFNLTNGIQIQWQL